MGTYCVYEWDGLTWNKIEDHCPPGEHCDPPKPATGTPVGSWTVVFCVPD